MMRGVTALYRHAYALRVLLFAVGVAWSAVALPAVAQVQSVVAPVRDAVDDRGVDLSTGQFRLSSAEVAIGQPGAGGLAFGRAWIGSGWRDALAGTISSSGAVYTVSLGGSSESFTFAMGVYTSNQLMGSTLTFASSKYTFTLRDGTVAEFDTAAANCSGVTSFWACNAGMITKLTKPDLEILTWTYTTATVGGQTARRPQSVSNNLGYQLHFAYANNAPANPTELTGAWLQRTKVTGINRAYYFCADTSVTCSDTTGGNWPYVTYGSEVGGVETVTDRLSQTTRYVISSNQMTAVRLPTSSTAARVTIAYTSAKVSNVETTIGGWSNTAYSYSDVSGVRTTTTTPYAEGRPEITLTNLTTGWVTENWDDDAGTRKEMLTRDVYGRITRVTQSAGDYVDLTYDARGNVTQVIRVPKTGSGLANITTTTIYPASCTNTKTCNQPTSTTDARGYRTDYTYDATHGGLLTATLPAPTGAVPVGTGTRPQTRLTYALLSAWYKNSAGTLVAGPGVYRPTQTSACATGVSPACVGTSTETRTIIAFQAGSASVPSNLLAASKTTRSGNTSGTGAVSSVVAATYTVQGDTATIDGPLSGTGDTAYLFYDDVRRLRASASPDPDGAGTLQNRITRASYDAESRVTAVETGHATSPANWPAMSVLQTVTTTYDSTYGILGKGALSASGTTYAVRQFGIGPNFSRCAALRMNPSEFASLPGDGCTADTAGTYGPDRFQITGYNGYREGVSVADGTVDAFGSPTRLVRTMQYGASTGTLDYLTDAAGNATKYEYDGFSRAVKTIFPSTTMPGIQNASDYEQQTYDAFGRLTSIRGRDGNSFALSYDNLGRMTLKDAPGTQPDVNSSYDNFGRLLTKSQTGQTVTYAYDALSRLISETNGSWVTGYQYDSAGRRTRLTWPDAFFVTYDYNTVGEVTAIRENGVASGVGVLATFTYDNLGRRTALTRGNGGVTGYSYDGASQLIDLALDPGGTANDVWTDLSYNPAGQIVSRTINNAGYNFTLPAAYTDTYADNGLNQYTSAGGVTPTYTDSRGNMTNDGTKTYTYDYSNRMTGAGTASLNYDPSGRLYQVAGSTTVRFAYDGPNIIAEYNTSGTVVRRYVHGPGMDEPLVWYEGSGTTDRRHLYADERGSIVTVEGATTTKNTYDEYGVPGSGNVGRFEYTGQIWLSDVGLYHYKARAYNPEIGRFMQNDPIGYGDAMNMYNYVGGDPINATDPSGLQDAPRIIISATADGAPGYDCITDDAFECKALYDLLVRGGYEPNFQLDGNVLLPNGWDAICRAGVGCSAWDTRMVTRARPTQAEIEAQIDRARADFILLGLPTVGAFCAWLCPEIVSREVGSSLYKGIRPSSPIRPPNPLQYLPKTDPLQGATAQVGVRTGLQLDVVEQMMKAESPLGGLDDALASWLKIFGRHS